MKRRKRHPKYPDRDIYGRKLPGCLSPSPLAYKNKPPQESQESSQPVSVPVLTTDISQRLVAMLSPDEYLRSIVKAIRRGEPQARTEYRQALQEVRRLQEIQKPDDTWLRDLSKPELQFLRCLIERVSIEERYYYADVLREHYRTSGQEQHFDFVNAVAIQTRVKMEAVEPIPQPVVSSPVEPIEPRRLQLVPRPDPDLKSTQEEIEEKRQHSAWEKLYGPDSPVSLTAGLYRTREGVDMDNHQELFFTNPKGRIG